MKIKMVLWLLLGLSVYAQAQVVTIKDNETGEALEFATLMSENPRAFTVTNAKGQADIQSFEDSPKIEIRSLGYKTISMSYDQLLEQDFQVELMRSVVTMSELVVSATRWKQLSNTIPSKIVSVSPKEVLIQNPQTAADLLSLSGKVFIQKSQQGGGSPMIRGFATNRLLYTVDGVRMNTAIFRSGNLQNVISLDPFAIENTEVFFGPGSVIYGSDAIGGVMSFQTLTPQLSLNGTTLLSGQALTRYSSANNEKTAHFNVNVGWEKWALVTSISSFNYGDLRMGTHGPTDYLRPYYVRQQDGVDVVVTNPDPLVQTPSGYSQINLMQKVRFKPNENWDIQYGFHYSETSNYDRYDRHLRTRNGLPRYGEWYYGPQKWMMNNLSISHTANSKLYDQLTLRMAYQFFEESRISRDFNKTTREIRIEKVNAYSVNLDFAKATNTKNTLYYGLEYVYDKVNSIGIDENSLTGTQMPGPSRYPQSGWVSYAAYLNNQYKFSDKWLIQAGLRYNFFSLNAEFDTTFYPFPYTTASLNNGALTGSLGFVYRPTDEWVVSMNLATAFRAPNVDDMGKVFDSEPGSVVVPNPDLKAEYAYNADFGIARTFYDVVKIDFTAYYTYLKNAMVRRGFTLNGLDNIMYDGTLSQVQAIQNAAFAHIYGLQAGLEVKLPYGFGFVSDFNYQKGEEELDDGTTSPSRHAPPWFGVSRLTYSVNRLNMQWYVVYSGKKKYENMPEEEKGKTEIYALNANGNPYAPGWYTLNFKASYQMNQRWTVSAGLENITDQRYRPYSSGIAAPGRNFILSFRAGF